MAALLCDDPPWGSWEDFADRLIANGVRHLPSLADDPEAVEKVARWLKQLTLTVKFGTTPWDELDDDGRALWLGGGRNLLHALAATEDDNA